MSCEYRTEYGAQRGACTQSYALAQCHAEIAHGEAECQTSHAPQSTEQDGQPGGLWVCVHKGHKVAEGTACTRDGQQGSDKREQKPGKDSLDDPIAFPTPVPDLVDRDIAGTLAECPDGDDK